jgi:hypothetical protein
MPSEKFFDVIITNKSSLMVFQETFTAVFGDIFGHMGNFFFGSFNA